MSAPGRCHVKPPRVSSTAASPKNVPELLQPPKTKMMPGASSVALCCVRGEGAGPKACGVSHSPRESEKSERWLSVAPDCVIPPNTTR